ncbi:MAG: hypothetical protein DMD81_16755 [Candidatus Rokuibacteriota bacterium]|nr:MAG: hypothetical protein DMD81_16755 [Candidatus Rokubacteria bacterium]
MTTKGNANAQMLASVAKVEAALRSALCVREARRNHGPGQGQSTDRHQLTATPSGGFSDRARTARGPITRRCGV